MASNPFVWLRIAHMIVAFENWMILLVSFLATWKAEYHIYCPWKAENWKLQVPKRLSTATVTLPLLYIHCHTATIIPPPIPALSLPVALTVCV